MVSLPRSAFQAGLPTLTALFSIILLQRSRFTAHKLANEWMFRIGIIRRCISGASGGTRTPGVLCLLTREVLSPLSHTSKTSVAVSTSRHFLLHKATRQTNYSCHFLHLITKLVPLTGLEPASSIQLHDTVQKTAMIQRHYFGALFWIRTSPTN